MIDFPFLTLLLVLPLIGVGLLAFVNGTPQQILKNSRAVTLWTTTCAFLVFLVVWFQFDSAKSNFQLTHHIPSIGGLGIEYHIGIDGVSLLMLLLTTLLIPLVVLAGWSSIQQRPKTYYIALLCLETFLIGSFISLNVLMFYVFFEAILIPMFLMIGIWGGSNRIYATFKFFLYTFLGSILVLVAFLVIGTYVQSFNLMDWTSAIEHSFFGHVGRALWWALFIGFAIKIPMFPVHTWLPDAHVEAPATASMILAGVLLKLGGYAMIRFHLLAFPQLSMEQFPIIAALSIIAIVYASLVAWAQSDMKKLVAYSSIAHMGYVTIGLYSQSVIGVKGAVIQMVSHGITSAGLFFVVDMLYRRTHTRDMHQYRGVVAVAPKLTAVAFMLVLGLVSLPMTSGFVGELMVTIAAFKVSTVIGILTALGVILAPIYGLNFYRQVFLGKPSETAKKINDVTLKEMGISAGLICVMLWLGLYPKPFMTPLEGTAKRITREA